MCRRVTNRCLITLLGWVDKSEKPEEVTVSNFFVLIFLQCSLWMRARAMLSKTQKNTKSGLTESMQNIYISSTYFAVLIMLQLWAIKIQLFSYIRKKNQLFLVEERVKTIKKELDIYYNVYREVVWASFLHRCFMKPETMELSSVLHFHFSCFVFCSPEKYSTFCTVFCWFIFL